MQLRQSQIRRQLSTAEPHRAAAVSGVFGQRNRVASDLSWVMRAHPLADQRPGIVEAGEELLLTRRTSGGGADRPPERHSSAFLASECAADEAVVGIGHPLKRHAQRARECIQLVLNGSRVIGGRQDLFYLKEQACMLYVIDTDSDLA